MKTAHGEVDGDVRGTPMPRFSVYVRVDVTDNVNWTGAVLQATGADDQVEAAVRKAIAKVLETCEAARSKADQPVEV